MDGPRAYAFDLGQDFEDLFVRSCGQGGKVQLSVHNPPRHIADVLDLLLREPDCAQFLNPEFQDRLGRQLASTACGRKPAENHLGYLSAELLQDNGLDESLEAWLEEFDAVRPNALNKLPQNGVGGH
jgi:hypothetical protein